MRRHFGLFYFIVLVIKYARGIVDDIDLESNSRGFQFESLAVVPSAQTLCDALKSVKVLDIASKVKKCVTSQNANYGKVTPSHGAVMVVSHREMVIGCYDFDRLFLPDTETIIVLDEDFVNIWRLDQLVANATRAQTLGTHLVITSAHAGDVISKRIAMEFVDKFAPLEFIFAVNCDVHEMPLNYVGYKTFANMIASMSTAFRAEKVLRKANKTNVEDAASLGPQAFHPIFAMNAVQVEDRKAEIMHGVDVSKWISRGGFKGKPAALGSKPWMTDSSRNVETHIMLLDVDVFKSLASLYFIVDSLNPEQLTMPQICKLRSVVVIRHNEMVTFLDFVTNGQLLKSAYYTNKLNPYQMNYMLLRNFELVAERRNPKYVYDEFYALENVGIKLPQQYGLGFVARNFRPHWLPNFNGKSATDPLVVRFLNASMKLAGYSYKGIDKSNKFALYFAEMCYPQSVQMKLLRNATGDNIAAQFRYKNASYYLMSNFQYRVPFPKDSVAARTIAIPIFATSIAKSLGSTVTNAFDDLKVLTMRSQYLKSPKCPVN